MTTRTTEKLFAMFVEELVIAPPHARLWLAHQLVRGTDFILVPKRKGGHLKALPAPADVIPLQPRQGG